MDAKDASSTSLPESPRHRHSLHQDSSNSYRSPSRSSQAYSDAASGTGASTQSATVTTEDFDPIAYEATIAHDMQALSAVPDGPDRAVEDLRLIGSWAAANPNPDAFVIEHDPILSPVAINAANRENQNTEAVGVLRASLRREVPEEKSAST